MEETKLSMPLVGKKLPDFELKAYQNEAFITVKSTDYRGKWLILFFYPADFTFVCPTELGDLTHYYSEFQNKGAEVLSVSTDTHFAHKAWHDESESIKKIKFPMLADPTGEFCRSLGVYIPEEGLALRASFVVDPDGIIKAYEVHDNAIGRSAAELLRKLHAAKFVREHGDEVCPANWKPGEKTLKPGIDLVGKL